MNMHKEDRQNKILNFIESHDVVRQDELVNMLGDLGLNVTQASVSRDLLELGISKIKGKYSLSKEIQENDIFSIQSIESIGENLMVMKCGIGMAPAVALKIDNADIKGIAGTIAGDDTIFIAVKASGNRSRIVSAITRTLKNG